MTEADFQRLVLDLLHVTGWEVMHVRRSIGRRGGTAAWQTTTSIAGWPDLFAFSPMRRQHFAVELKSQHGRLSPEQRGVLERLEAAGVRTFVWRPADWRAIVSVAQYGLSREENQP